MTKLEHKRNALCNTPHYNHHTVTHLTQLGERLADSIYPMSNRAFAELWNISPVSVGRYIQGKQSPRIEDLAKFAQLTNTDLLWLIGGEHYAQKRWLQPTQFIECCTDDTMAPTLLINTPVVVETIMQDGIIPNGIYCLESAQGQVFRRLQWDEEKQGFWLRCDNLHFEPPFSQAPNIIGKVVGALTPVF